MEKLNVGLLGGSFCCLNFGVGALAISQCMILDKVAKDLHIKLDVVCYESQITPFSYLKSMDFDNLNIVLDTHSYNVSVMRRKLNRHHIVIDMNGGDSFSDIYSVKGFIIGALQRIFSLNKSQIYIMAPQTIGPFKNRIAYSFAKKVMNKADRIFIRDLDSLRLVNKENKNKVVSVTDMAFLLPYHKANDECFRVGLNVSGLLWEGNLLGNVRNEYRRTIRAIINFLKMRNITIVLVPHVLDIEYSLDGDLCVSKKIKEEFSCTIEISPEFKDPMEVKSFISGCSFFIGSRMHATIAAVSSGVPSLAIAYSKKFSGVFNVLGYQYVVEKTHIDVSNVIKTIDNMLENYDSVKQELNRMQQIADEKLGHYASYLKEVIQTSLYEKDR